MQNYAWIPRLVYISLAEMISRARQRADETIRKSKSGGVDDEGISINHDYLSGAVASS